MIVKKENNKNNSKKDLLLVDKTIKMKNKINEEGKMEIIIIKLMKII